MRDSTPTSSQSSLSLSSSSTWWHRPARVGSANSRPKLWQPPQALLSAPSGWRHVHTPPTLHFTLLHDVSVVSNSHRAPMLHKRCRCAMVAKPAQIDGISMFFAIGRCAVRSLSPWGHFCGYNSGHWCAMCSAPWSIVPMAATPCVWQSILWILRKHNAVVFLHY